MRNAVTVQDLLRVESSISGEVTTVARHELRGLIMTIESIIDGSLVDGLNNLEAVRQIHRIIDGLVDEGILPDDARIGRESFLGIKSFSRTAIRTPVYYLMEYQEDIEAWVEDHTSHRGIDVFKVLIAAAEIGASMGMTPTQSGVLNVLFPAIRGLPSGQAKMKALRNKDVLLKLLPFE